MSIFGSIDELGLEKRSQCVKYTVNGAFTNITIRLCINIILDIRYLMRFLN